jgi:hypothetical protein
MPQPPAASTRAAADNRVSGAPPTGRTRSVTSLAQPVGAGRFCTPDSAAALSLRGQRSRPARAGGGDGRSAQPHERLEEGRPALNQPPIKNAPQRLRQRWRARKKSWRIWWEPSTDLRELGLEVVELDSKRLTWSVREAERLNGLVDQRRSGGVAPSPSSSPRDSKPAQPPRSVTTLGASTRSNANGATAASATSPRRSVTNGMKRSMRSGACSWPPISCASSPCS